MENAITTQNGNSMLAPANMEQAMKLADMMAKANLVPLHLQGKAADCLLVIEQASRWKMSPFAVAQCTSVIKGKLMYEGKLVAAVVNANGGLEERLSFDYRGEKENRTITVSGRFKGEKEPRIVEVCFKDVKTENSMWLKQPDQQLMYSGTRAWARRHAPELMLGVYSPEEFEPNGMVDVTPEPENKASIFKNASLRNTFCKNAIASFDAVKKEAANCVEELNEIFTLNMPKLKEMKDSGNEHDLMAAEEIHKRYKQALVRLKVPAQEITADGEVIDNEEDEVPPFVKKQMEDENDRLAALGNY